MHRSNIYNVFNVFNIIFFMFVAVSMVFPFINVLCLSLEPNHIAIETGVIHLIPKEITFKAYIEIWKEGVIPIAFKNSVIITVAGSLGGLLVTAMLAYGLTFEQVIVNRFVSYLLMFTMMFSGGIIPSYMLVKKLGMIDTLWALIIPSLMSAGNVILMRVFFRELPSSLAESAMLDGCTEVGIFFRIVLPLSMPIIATVILFYAVGKWNEFFTGVMYINDQNKKPLQVILREILLKAVNQDYENAGYDKDIGMNVKMASVFVSIVPIFMTYPFLQKYFSKGILLGAVKG